MKLRDYFARTLVIVGAINWGLIGFFNFDLVSAIFGVNLRAVSRIVFALVGLAGLYCLSLYGHLDEHESESENVYHAADKMK